MLGQALDDLCNRPCFDPLSDQTHAMDSLSIFPSMSPRRIVLCMISCSLSLSAIVSAALKTFKGLLAPGTRD